jgi:hypothetical protein
LSFTGIPSSTRIKWRGKAQFAEWCTRWNVIMEGNAGYGCHDKERDLHTECHGYHAGCEQLARCKSSISRLYQARWCTSLCW